MRLIPGKTKVKIELFKGVSLTDIIIGAIAFGLMMLVLMSNLPGKLYFCIAVVFIAALLLVRFDSEPSYVYIRRMLRHYGNSRHYDKVWTDDTYTTDGDLFDKVGDELFSDDEEDESEKTEPVLSKKEEKALYKEEQKILKSRNATKEEKDAVWLARANRSAAKKSAKKETRAENISYDPIEDIIAFTGIKDGFIEYAGEYYGAAIEIPPVEFRFFSENRRSNSIENAVGRVLRNLNPDYAANIVKIERPVLYDSYIDNEYEKLEEVKLSYERGVITEEELKARVEVLYERINELRTLCFENKVVQPYYYIVLFDGDKKQLDIRVDSALDTLRAGELLPKRLNDKELAVFLKYNYEIDFDERDIEKIKPEDYAAWAMPQTVSFKARTTEINHIVTHNLRVINYPMEVGDAWMAGLMSIPATRVMIKAKPMDHGKSVTAIDHSIQEIRDRLNSTGIESRRIELSAHADSLSELLVMLQGENETLLSVNIYVTAYDINSTKTQAGDKKIPDSNLANITSMKKTVRRIFSESRVKLENLDFSQLEGFIGAGVSGYDPRTKDGRGIPSNSVAAAYPWIYANILDKKGIKLGMNEGVPVFVDFFRRDDERVNSNMVIVGKSGSGKSYATKSFLTNLAADDAKIFILDPENEYSELANSLHGKIINVGNASQGRLNPFHIITALEDDEDGSSGSNSYSTHLQFLEEFFKQSLPDCEKDALEYLNALIDRCYLNKGITNETNLGKLRPEDYPIFDDLYDTILAEFQVSDNEYIRRMLRTLLNYISKFSTGGRNASIWNGPSTVTTEENFTVFNFQSLLANRNSTIANSQMLLVLKYIDNEIIKNREYNIKYKANRKIIVVIDEAHVFIDAKYPVALDFMFQLAKRIRKYNGMQIVITQNIKDFVGSEEIARKSTAIINACQYSFIFSLSPNDMDDLCLLYEKSGGINENEQEQIVSAPRGHAFAIMSSQHRSSFKVHVSDGMVDMFSNPDFKSAYFTGEDGENNWLDYIGKSREVHDFNIIENTVSFIENEIDNDEIKAPSVVFTEMTDEEYAVEDAEKERKSAAEQAAAEVKEEARAAYIENLKADARSEYFGENVNSNDGKVTFFEEPNKYFADTDDIDNIRFEEIATNYEEPKKPVTPAQHIVVESTPSAGLEAVLAKLGDAVENIGRMNYDSIMAEVRSMLDNRSYASADTSPAPTVQTNSEEESSGLDSILGNIFSLDDDSDNNYGYNTETEDNTSESSFDILAFLAQQAENKETESPIDLMVENDELCITVSIDELAAYNLSKKVM